MEVVTQLSSKPLFSIGSFQVKLWHLLIGFVLFKFLKK